MNDLAIGLIAVIAAFILFNQLAIIGQIRVLRGLFTWLNSQLGENPPTTQASAESKSSIMSRRIKFRAQMSVPGTLVVSGTSHPIVVQDISQTGAMIRCEAPLSLKINYEYPFETTLPTKQTIRAVLKIIRVVNPEENLYGGCFVNLSLAEKKVLAKYVNQSASDALQQDPLNSSTYKHI